MPRSETRDENGRFARGNPGGPGRPRRAVEQEYLSALSEELPVGRWRRIVQRAIEDAEQGDWRAREWLAKFVLGPDPKVATTPYRAALRLFQLVVEEAKGGTVTDQIEDRVRSDRLSRACFDNVVGSSP